MLVLVALVVGFAVFDFGITGTLAVITVGRYLGAAVYLGLLLRHSPSFQRVDVGLARRMFKYGFRVYVAIVLSYLVVRFDLLLVNGYLGERKQASTGSRRRSPTACSFCRW